MQNTFVTAIKSLKTFKGHSSVKTWLIGVAKNKYYTYVRKTPKNIQIEEIGEISYIQEQTEAYISIMDEIQKLQDPQKQLLILRCIYCRGRKRSRYKIGLAFMINHRQYLYL